MLKILNSLADIDFRQLMDVYEEGNCINGNELYGKYSKNLQIIYAEQDFYNYLVEFFEEPSARYAVWIHNGRYVSALRLERYCDGLLMNALETIPVARKQGYAKKLIMAVLDYLRNIGCGRLYSHVQKDNVASLCAHLSCGFMIASETAVYLDSSVRSDSYSLCINY